MLSYRHAYHAGNFADVMKHVVLTAMLRYMTRKEAPLCYIDTHAGAGSYDLCTDVARKTGESSHGIGRLWNAPDLPEPVANYLSLVQRCNPDGKLRIYPGSPRFAAMLLRPQDRLVLCELHSSDFPLLRELFARDRRVHCHMEDGYRFSAGLVPPREHRGLIMMDPSYELAGEYDTALHALQRLHRRFSSGTFALWYPILDERRTASLRTVVERSAIRDVLHLSLTVADRGALPGMYGCAVIVINPPWTLHEEMSLALPYLATKLGRNHRASYHIEQWVDE